MAWRRVKVNKNFRESDPTNSISALQAVFIVKGIGETEKVVFG